MDIISKSLSETEKIAKEFVIEQPGVRFIGLSGNLGSGKSVFVRGAAKALGVKKNITSPTFVIMKSYPAQNGNLIHIDAYRLTNSTDLESLGFNELLADKQNMIFIEWPEKVFNSPPDYMKKIKFEYINENSRKISY